jgi:hypothetical protein
VVLRETVAKVGHFWSFGDLKRSVRAFFFVRKGSGLGLTFSKR